MYDFKIKINLSYKVEEKQVVSMQLRDRKIWILGKRLYTLIRGLGGIVVRVLASNL